MKISRARCPDAFAPARLRPKRFCQLASLGVALAVSAARIVQAADPNDPILDLLLQKGVVSQEEVDKARAQAEAIRSNSVATSMAPMESKWKISNTIKNLELYGDIRARFEDRQAKDPKDGKIDLERLRYAVRLGLRGEVESGFYFGTRLDTAANPRSPWVTAGTSSSSTPYQGPFGKSTAGINVGQAYLGWRFDDIVDITLGKMPNPLYTTPMTWDTDLNPEGAAERFKASVGAADFFINLGQFLYQDTNPVETPPGYFNLNFDSSNPVFLMAWQGGVELHITKELSVKVAPVLYSYTGFGVNNSPPGVNVSPDFTGTFVGQGSTNGVGGTAAFSNNGPSGYPNGPFAGFAANQTGIRDLLVFDIPWEVNLKLERANLNLRLFGDYAWNLEGSDRANHAFLAQQNNIVLADQGVIPIPSPQTSDTKAYQIGLAVGNHDSLGLVYGTTSRKHAWEVRTYWQHIEQYALDVNLIDSDFFEGRGNLEGLYTAFAYGLTDHIIATARYGFANQINDKVGTGGSNQDIPQMNPIHSYHIFQFDMSFRF
jgi:hypothetical protein